MKYKISLLIFTIIFFGCRKSELPLPKEKTYFIAEKPDSLTTNFVDMGKLARRYTYRFSFSPDGQLTQESAKLTHYNPDGKVNEYFEYPIKYIYQNGLLTLIESQFGTTTLTYENLLPVSCTTFSYINGTIQSLGQQTFEYSAQGKIVRTTSGNRAYYFEWNGDNIFKVTATELSTNITLFVLDQFKYDDKPNPFKSLQSRIYQRSMQEGIFYYLTENNVLDYVDSEGGGNALKHEVVYKDGLTSELKLYPENMWWMTRHIFSYW